VSPGGGGSVATVVELESEATAAVDEPESVGAAVAPSPGTVAVLSIVGGAALASLLVDTPSTAPEVSSVASVEVGRGATSAS
jgi:hypothetical protein